MNKEHKRLQGLEWDPRPHAELGRGCFLTLQSRRLRSLFQDGSHSAWYEVETVYPPFLDAVVLLLFAIDSQEMPHVALRRAARPSVALRSGVPQLANLDGRAWSGALWELPAGGIEPPDLEPGGLGVLGRAQREALEETGLSVPAEAFFALGHSPFSAPAFCLERLHYLAAPVDPAQAQPPQGDGHPMEDGAEVRFLSLREALAWCASGRIIDGKTELGLRRLADWLHGGQPG
ncbi:MAG: NUDIX domain-containing protein [Pseudomonadota bacterium]